MNILDAHKQAKLEGNIYFNKDMPVNMICTEILKVALKQEAIYNELHGKQNNTLKRFDINLQKCQQRIKTTLQINFCEELVELLEALKCNDSLNVYEEFADVLGFYLAYLLDISLDKNIKVDLIEDFFAALQVQTIVNDKCFFEQKEFELLELADYERQKLYSTIVDTIIEAQSLCNILKARQWSQTHYLVDYYELQNKAQKFNQRVASIADIFSLNLQGILQLYCCKTEVNKFRVQSGY